MKQPVTWKVGDHLAIASTGNRNSQKENEEHYIEAISEDRMTITLKDPLKYRHISIEQTFGGRVVETRGEVALLNRNILIRGTVNEQFKEVLPACDVEFNSGGAFSDSLQNCFAGKFGEELGTDEMGAVIIISPKYKDQGLVSARFSYVELTSVGQAFRVGRYPIHFHLPGIQNESYVRGVSIHHSNNRACTLHDVTNITIEHNVAYNIKGLTFFLEDGVEMYNVLQYNLAIFTRMSNSLLNPDINPASFWIVNPYNKFRHNSCAGGTHLCFWLRPATIPDGPSYVRKFCPNKVPFDKFYNNTAHSMGWYGFWIFGQSNHAKYDPHTGTLSAGFCNGYRTQARLGSFTTWNNKRGFEIVSGANIRLENQTHMDHDFSAFEIFTAQGPYGPGGAGIFNSVIVGHSLVSDLTAGKETTCMPAGIHLPPNGYTLENVSFYNFDKGPNCYAMGIKISEPGAVAMPVRVSGLKFYNTTQRQFTPKNSEQGIWYRDIDGSLTGSPGKHLVTKSYTNPTDHCVDDTSNKLGGDTRSAICDESVTFHKLTILNSLPTSMHFNKMLVKNQWGNSTRLWMDMVDGWNALLPQGPLNLLTFDTVEHLTNISYDVAAYGMHKGENYLIVGHDLVQQPDRFNILINKETNDTGSLDSPPTFDNSENGNWYFTNETGGPKSQIQYIFSSKGSLAKQSWWKKRETQVTDRSGDLGVWPQNDIAIGKFSVFQCENTGCVPTPPPVMDSTRPESFIRWSEPDDWRDAELEPPFGLEEIAIPRGAWVLLDISPPKFKRLFVYGTLEIEDTEDRRLEVEILLVMGGRLIVGSKEIPFQHNFELILHGDHYTQEQYMFDAPNLGAKALGVYGDSVRTSVYPGLIDMHGVDKGNSWVKLAKTANSGDTVIEILEDVQWVSGDHIIITSTNYESLETEKRIIKNITNKTITLTEPLLYTHLSIEESVSGESKKYTMRGEVGLLSRNVKIIGAQYDDQEEEMFGARVIAAAFKEGSLLKPGYVRFSNVEFQRVGQEGYSDSYDPRYSLAIMNSNPEEFDLLPIGRLTSYVKSCAFDYNYNSAIGIFESSEVSIENNVIYRHIDDGILDESHKSKIIRNLIARAESINEIKKLSFAYVFKGCINILRGTETILQNNVMAGCAQGGLLTQGNLRNIQNLWTGNEIHSSQHGIHVTSKGLKKIGCVTLKNFLVWRNYEYGIMAMTEDNLEVEDLILVENGVSFMMHGIGPSATAHLIQEDRHASLQNSLIVAHSAAFDCNNDIPPKIMNFIPERIRAWTGRNFGFSRTAMLFPIFQSNFPKPDFRFHQGVKSAEGSNPALRGILYLNQVIFVNFDGSCGKKQTVFRTNALEDDMNWPIQSSGLKFINVKEEFKILYDRPLASKINPADCTDFDCDGMKKALLIDKDGTLLGNNGGTVIPDSAFEWDGNPRNGLGYFRVPKAMITDVNGNRIPYNEKMPNKGIYKNDQCTWIQQWSAFKCHGVDHKLMIIESLDRDSRIRRLSPIAVLADPGNNGYIDLVNGPQDHSCCQGYTCAERLSTFYTMIATGLEYEIVMSSIPPQNFRFHLLHNEEESPVRVKMWFPKQQRLDIYTNGEYVPPNNKDFSVIDSLQLLEPSESYIPSMTDNNHCSNYFDPNTGHLYLLIKEKSTCNIKTQPAIILKLGIVVKEDEFFDEDKIVGNIAGLLGIPLNKIRITNIIRENSRRKRSIDSSPGVELEISEPPELFTEDYIEPLPTYTTPADPNNPTPDPKYTTTPGTPTTSEPVNNSEDKLDYDQLLTVSSKLVSSLQTGELSELLGYNVSSIIASKPIEPPESEPEYTSPEERARITDKTFAELTKEENDVRLAELNDLSIAKIPTTLVIGRQIYEAKEMTKMEFYPYLYLTTSTGEQVEVVGGSGDVWYVTATLVTGPAGAELRENVTAPFINGLANFTDLLFSQKGTGYKVQFELTYPDDLNIESVTTKEFEVGGRPLGIVLEGLSKQVPDNEDILIKYYIYDLGQNMKATPDIIGNVTWECSLAWAINTPVEIVGEKDTFIAEGKSKKKYLNEKLLRYIINN